MAKQLAFNLEKSTFQVNKQLLWNADFISSWLSPGKLNQAASTFVSSIIREPLQGGEAICPVNEDVVMWLLSPRKLIEALLHTINIDKKQLNSTRKAVNLPGISISVKEMIECLEQVAGIEIIRKIQFVINPDIERLVRTWPKKIDARHALNLGYHGDSSFEEIINNFRNDDLIL